MVHERLKNFIDEKGFKQAAIARAIGVTDSVLSQMLAGKVRMTAEVFMAICAFLEVDPGRFAQDEVAR